MEAMVPDQTRVRVKVVGVGGAGCNAVTHMVLADPRHTEVIAVDTDAASLAGCGAPVKVCIGDRLDEGLGTDGNPVVAQRAAEEFREELRDTLRGADMILVTAGMGGGTGSGAAPVVAQLARELGAVTVGVVTKPFNFEGTRRRRVADNGAQALRESVDTLIAVPNDRLLTMADKKTTMSTAFALADDLLGTAIQSISGIFTTPGLLTLSFSEARRLLMTRGYTAIGFGRASGKDRAAAAAMQALRSPLLEDALAGADSVLFTFAGSRYTSAEVVQAAVKVMAAAKGGNSTWLGTRVAEGLNDEVEVLVLATTGQSGPRTRWDIMQPPNGPPDGGPPPADQRIARRPPMNPSAGAAQMPLPEPIPNEADAVGSIAVPWIQPNRSTEGGVSPR
jgi:cell division protein FtsZ